MHPALVVLVGLLFLSAACIEVERQVEISPESVPERIRGARWAEAPVSYCVARDGQSGFVDDAVLTELAQRAVAAWGVPVEFLGDCAAGVVTENDANEIGWGDLGEQGESLTEAGSTNIRYRTGPGGGQPEIVEADVTLETDPANPSEACLYTTLLHEAGHLFGVPHLGEDTVMSPVILECRQELTPADRSAIEELYQ